MDIWQETNWYAIQAKPFAESLAASSVAQFDIEVFLPKIRQEQLVCGAWRMVTKPLFPGYFFARFCPLLSLEPVRYAHGVVRVVGGGRFPLSVDPGLVLALRDRVELDGFIRLEPQLPRVGEKVAILQGPFAGWMGRVEREADGRKRVMILLEAMQQTRVEIDARWLAASEARE